MSTTPEQRSQIYKKTMGSVLSASDENIITDLLDERDALAAEVERLQALVDAYEKNWTRSE